MAKRANSKAAKIRAILAERPDAKASEIVAALAAQKVKVTLAQVYNLKSTMGKSTTASRLLRRHAGPLCPGPSRERRRRSPPRARRVAKAYGSLPINIRTVRQAMGDEIEFMRWHDQTVAEESA